MVGRSGSGQPCLLQGASETSRRVTSALRRPSMEAISETPHEDSGGEELAPRQEGGGAARGAGGAAPSPFCVPGLPVGGPRGFPGGSPAGDAALRQGLKGEPLPGCDQEEELTWFSAGLRLGAGLGVGVCIGTCLGVGLLVKGYHNVRGYASGAMRGRIFS